MFFRFFQLKSYNIFRIFYKNERLHGSSLYIRLELVYPIQHGCSCCKQYTHKYIYTKYLLANRNFMPSVILRQADSLSEGCKVFKNIRPLRKETPVISQIRWNFERQQLRKGVIKHTLSLFPIIRISPLLSKDIQLFYLPSLLR